MAGLEETEILYFAAHAGVEQWADGARVNSESAWADGSDFPGANWATYFAGGIPASIDVTGYWDWFWTPDGEPEIGPTGRLHRLRRYLMRIRELDKNLIAADYSATFV